MENSTFSFVLTPTDPAAELGFEAWINDRCVFDSDCVSSSVTVTVNLPSDSVETEHTLKLVLKNKLSEHTQISESGEIVNDACLTVSNLSFDGIELGQMVNDLAMYQHDFNGTQPTIQEQFFGTMGCNGTVKLKFTTPVYLWILENM
jgi:hypothetical protein